MSFFSYKPNISCESKVKYPHAVVTGSCGNIPERLIVCQPFLWIAKGFRTEQDSEVSNSGPGQTTDVCGRMVGKLKVEACTLSSWWTLHKQGPLTTAGSLASVSLKERGYNWIVIMANTSFLLTCSDIEMPVSLLTLRRGELIVAMWEGQQKWKREEPDLAQTPRFLSVSFPFPENCRFAFLPKFL